MKTVFKNIFYLFLFLATLSACQSVKDGLTGKKQTNMDEFLVKKKDPLVLPPEFEKLPQPTSAESTPSPKLGIFISIIKFIIVLN